MYKLIFFIAGAFFGGFISFVALCALQLSRVRSYEIKREDKHNETNN